VDSHSLSGRGVWGVVFHRHPYQGVILLLVLSDWEVGAGGTCMVHGSHRWVRDQIVAAGHDGLSHDELNRWCVDHMIARAREQTLELVETAATPGGPPNPTHDDDAESNPRAVQIVARAGDVVIMHPLIVHSGTTNLGSRPRLMANGMARVRQDVFDTEGHALFPRPHEHAAA
jgi:ectoine hydroxylase-related dioxygenase (phytanoyl-CoA dioxygenase family)